MEKQDVFITTPYIRLDSLLKLSGLAETGGHAKVLIQEGLINLNGEVSTQRGRKIRPGDVVVTQGNSKVWPSEMMTGDGVELHVKEKI